MKILLISIPLLFCCIQDSTRVDTLKPVKLFFEQRSPEQISKDINIKLDLLLVKLQEAKKDTTDGNK